MKRILGAVAAALILAGCGSGQHPSASVTTRHSAPAPASRCVPGNSFMGCSQPAPGLAAPRSLTVPAGRKFVDVSSFQPSINWTAVKASGVFGVVIKAGEGLREDPTWERHVAGAKAAGLQVQAYWFERPVGCSAEGAAINRVVPKGIRVTFDMEVSGIQGYGACQRAAVRAHTGIDPDEYTAAGTWPGGSGAGMELWDATYGPRPDLAGLAGFGKFAAWQFTDSASVPGIGRVDESVDMGLFPKPAQPLPKCFTHRMTRSACAAAKRQIASDQRAAASSQRAYVARGCQVLSQRVNWFSTQLRRHPKVKTASRRRALAASRKAYRRQDCATFRNRVETFTGRAAAVKAAN